VSLSAFELTLVLAVFVFVAGLAAVRYFSTEETPTLPRVLIQFSLTVGLLTALATGAVYLNAEKVDYTAERNSQACELHENTTASDSDAEPVLEYSELSPEAREVFRSALDADGEYTTNTAPSEFQYRTDGTDGENPIRYDAACYELTAEQRGGFGTAFAISLLSLAGGGLTAVSGFASVVSLLLLSLRQRGRDTQ
jgi:uncharacterized membrane protein